MIIGYSVLYVSDDTTVTDALWNKRVVYSTWERALEQSHLKAEEEKKRYDNSSIISLVKSKSNEVCIKMAKH